MLIYNRFVYIRYGLISTKINENYELAKNK